MQAAAANRFGRGRPSMEGGGNTAKRKGEAKEHGGSSAKRLACHIESEAFCCASCDKILKPPIFQCEEGHFICSSCRDEVVDEPPAEANCPLPFYQCSGTLAHSHGMDRAVQSILVDCRYAEHGCTERTAYYDSRRHWSKCPHEPCECPEPGCGFAGTAAELLDHFTGHHKWPSTAFRYRVPFDLRVAEPGTRVLHCEDDGQLLLVSVQAAAGPPGRAVSIRRVRHRKPACCSVSFSCSTRHRGTAWSPLEFGWPPTGRYICHVPRVSGAPDQAGVVLTFSIDSSPDEDFEEEDDDPDDSCYVQSDDDGDSS